MRDNMVQKGVTDIMDRLRRQRDTMVHQLQECGDDEAGRAFLQESIDKIDALLAKYDQPKEVA